MKMSIGVGMVALLSAAGCEPGSELRTAAADLAGQVVVDAPSTLEMVYIPAGSFMRGSMNAEDERPVHEVSLSASYRVVRSGPSWIPLDGMGSSYRHADQQHVKKPFLGFRLVRELDAS